MKKNTVLNVKTQTTSRLKKCGVITCIHNIDGFCNMEKCEVYERALRQEY